MASLCFPTVDYGAATSIAVGHVEITAANTVDVSDYLTSSDYPTTPSDDLTAVTYNWQLPWTEYPWIVQAQRIRVSSDSAATYEIWPATSAWQTSVTISASNYYWPPLSKADRFRERMRQNLVGALVPSKFLDIVKDNDPEGRARALLRDMVGEREYRRYVTKGFTVVRGKTGLIYKIAYGMPIKCYAPSSNGGYIEYQSLCVVFRDRGLPPTDQVIMQRLLVQHDEFGLRSIANVSGLCDEKTIRLGQAGNMIRAAMAGKKREVLSHCGEFMLGNGAAMAMATAG